MIVISCTFILLSRRSSFSFMWFEIIVHMFADVEKTSIQSTQNQEQSNIHWISYSYLSHRGSKNVIPKILVLMSNWGKNSNCSKLQFYFSVFKYVYSLLNIILKLACCLSIFEEGTFETVRNNAVSLECCWKLACLPPIACKLKDDIYFWYTNNFYRIKFRKFKFFDQESKIFFFQIIFNFTLQIQNK